MKDVYLDSPVTIGLLSNVTGSSLQIEGERPRAPRNAQEAPRGEVVIAAQTAAARNFVNEISGSTRMQGNLEWIQEQTDQNEPDSWKGSARIYSAMSFFTSRPTSGSARNAPGVTTLAA